MLAFILYKAESVVKANPFISDATISEVPPFGPGTCDYYASPTGSASGSGTLSSPWSLHAALNKNMLIVAGKSLCLQGGTYSGKFKSILNGGTVRAAPNEYPVIDGYVSTTLVGDIDALQTTIAVADASKFVNSWRDGGATSLVVDGEALYINGVTGNTISVNRAAAGSSTMAVPHLSGTTVRLAGNQLYAAGSNTTYQAIEIMNSDPLRNWVTDGAEGLRGTGVFNTGDGNKFVNLIVHDNLSGIFSGSSSSNTEVYGTLSYNNGMFDNTAEGKGHGMYLENAAGYSRISDNIVLNNFGLGAQCYGRTAAYPGGEIQGNVFSNSGSPLGLPLRHYNLLVGTETQRIADILVQNNYLYHPHSLNGYNMTLGYGAGVDRGHVLNNYFVGGGGIGLELLDVIEVAVTGNKFNTTNPVGINIQSGELPYTVNNNSYYTVQTAAREFGDSTVSQTLTFASWKSITGFDSTSMATASPMPDTVIVRPNTYTPGRANVIVYTSSGASSVSLDLRSTGIADGQPYTIKNAFNYSGQAVATGVYSPTSATITLPLGGFSAYVATPVGGTSPTTTSPQFAVFIVVPAILPSPSPTSTPTATFTATPTFTPTPTSTATATFTPTPTFTPTATPISFVTGTVTYGNPIGSPNPRFVSNVLINGDGVPPSFTFTNFPNGIFLLGVGLGSYTVTPSKTGGQSGAISSFDAARIAQYVTGNITLNAAQQAVADVSGNGTINSFDAAQVARYSINSPPYGSTGSWVFSPASRTFTLITLNISGADYSGSLMGDVSGNWNNTGARSRNPNGSEKATDITAPSIIAPADGEVIVPVSVQGIVNKEIISYEFDLRYDPLVIQPQSDVIDLAGTVSSGLKAVANASETGLLRVAVYGPLPINSDGVLFNLKFTAVGSPGSVSSLTWERIMLNEGDPLISATDGRIELSSIDPPVD